MPPVKNDTARAEGGIRMAATVSPIGTLTPGMTGKPAPTQHDAQVEHKCAWWPCPW